MKSIFQTMTINSSSTLNLDEVIKLIPAECIWEAGNAWTQDGGDFYAILYRKNSLQCRENSFQAEGNNLIKAITKAIHIYHKEMKENNE